MAELTIPQTDALNGLRQTYNAYKNCMCGPDAVDSAREKCVVLEVPVSKIDEIDRRR